MNSFVNIVKPSMEEICEIKWILNGLWVVFYRYHLFVNFVKWFFVVVFVLVNELEAD